MHIDELAEIQSGKILHHVIEGTVVRAAVVEDLYRVPVSQLRCRLHLSLEPGQRSRIACFLGSDQLDRAGTFQKHMLGQIHFAHSTNTDLLLETILAQLLRFERLAA